MKSVCLSVKNDLDIEEWELDQLQQNRTKKAKLPYNLCNSGGSN